MDQTEEALGYAAEGKKFADDFGSISDVSAKDVGKFVAEMTPIVGDAMAAKEVYDELQKDEPNYYLAGALGGAALVGLFPGIGDVAAKAIRKGAREVFDVAKRVDVDMNAMGSGLGNVSLKPKQQDFKPAVEVEVDPNLKFYPDAGRLGKDARIVYDDDLVTKVDDLVDNWGMGELTPAELRKKLKPLGVTIEGNITKNRDMNSLQIRMPPSPRHPEGKLHFGMDTINPEPINSPSVSSADKEMISVFPKPERMFPEESRPKGGDYLNPATGEVLSGRNVSSAKLSISPEGKPSFKVSNDSVEEVGSVGKGKTQIKTNLFKKKAGWKWTEAPKGMEDIATLVSVENRGKHFYTTETDFSKGVNLKKYPNSKTEPRLRPTVVGEIELGPQIGLISVRGKEHPVYQNIKTFKEGGLVEMENQMINASDQTVQAFALGGDVEEFDPVSGNEVPTGSLPEEVRDDIPAQLSEGEYVVPADVVRFHGVKMFEELRAEAKMGFNTMENTGRIGGEPIGVAVMGDELPFDVSELNMQDDGEPEAPMMNKGGYMPRGYAHGGLHQNPVLKSTGGVEYKNYTNAEGKTLLIPFFNGVPMSVIPEGYFLVGTQSTNAEAASAAKAAAKSEADRKFQDDKGQERYEKGGDLYNPTPVIKMDELTGKELEKMVADQGSMTADMINVGVGVINPVMGLFMKLGMINSARETKNELERRANAATNPNEQAYYSNLLEIATQEEPGIIETVMGGIADTFSSITQSEKTAEEVKTAYTPEEFDPESNRGKYGYSDAFEDAGNTGYTVTPPAEVISTDLDDVPGERDDPYMDDALIPNKNMSEEEQYRSYGAGSRTTATTTPTLESTSTITKASNKGDKADENAAMRSAVKQADNNTKKVIAEAWDATPEEKKEIQKEGDRIKEALEDGAKGIRRGFNKGGLMKKKKK